MGVESEMGRRYMSRHYVYCTLYYLMSHTSHRSTALDVMQSNGGTGPSYQSDRVDK